MEVDEWDQPLEFSFECGWNVDFVVWSTTVTCSTRKCHPHNHTPLIRPSRRENK